MILWQVANMTIDVCFLLDLLVKLRTAYAHQGMTVTDARSIVARYWATTMPLTCVGVLRVWAGFQGRGVLRVWAGFQGRGELTLTMPLTCVGALSGEPTPHT